MTNAFRNRPKTRMRIIRKVLPTITLLLVLFTGLLYGADSFQASLEAGDQFQPLILAHYMPWYTAKPQSERWGWHWTMNHFDPEKVTDGRRDRFGILPVDWCVRLR